jgi:2-oxoglutarate ferredoxin oxidoreductase subunit alpha
VLVLSDLDLGMNNWMGEPFKYPDAPLNRGKVLSAEEVAALPDFGRYKDVDGDGVPYRTIPGNENPRAAWFGRGTGHDENAKYSERADHWVQNMDRLVRKFDTARAMVPAAVVDERPGATLGIVAYGTTRYAIEEARDLLAANGVTTDFMRIRALPIGAEVREFVARHERLVVIEMNRDGQLTAILRDELPEHAARLKPLAYLDGMPLTAAWVAERLAAHLGE